MRAPTKTGPGRVDAPLRIRQCFRWEVLPPDGVCLLSETQRVLFRGEGVCDVVPLLDGTRSIEDIFAELSDRVPPERVFSVLDRLRSDGGAA